MAIMITITCYHAINYDYPNPPVNESGQKSLNVVRHGWLIPYMTYMGVLCTDL